MNKEFDSKPAYSDNDKYIKAKIKIYGDNVNTNFHGKKMPKEITSCKWLSLTMLDSFIRVNKKHYPQTLLKECIYEIKRTKVENLMNDGLDPSSSDNKSDSDSDNDAASKSDNGEHNE